MGTEVRPGERIRPLRSRLRVDLLSGDEVERIVEAAFEVLARVGLQIDSEPVLRDLAAAGADVDLGAERVRFPRAKHLPTDLVNP